MTHGIVLLPSFDSGLLAADLNVGSIQMWAVRALS
jgi:hypothetical protein